MIHTRFTKKKKKRKPTKTKKKMRGGDLTPLGTGSNPTLPRGVSNITIKESPKLTELKLKDMLEKTNLNQLQKDDIIKIFHPNFMSIFLKSLILPIIYYYYEI